jgi:hypothetical protein
LTLELAQTRRDPRTPPPPVAGPMPLGPVHNNAISPPPKPRGHLANAGPGCGGGISTWENLGNLSHLRRLSLPNAPHRQSNVAPPGPQPGAVSPISPQAWHVWVTRLKSEAPHPSPPPIPSIPTNVLAIPLGANRLQIISSYHVAKQHPSVPPSHPTNPQQRNPPRLQPNELEARGPPFLLPSRSITDPALSLHCTPPSQQPSLPPPRLISIHPLPKRQKARLPDNSQPLHSTSFFFHLWHMALLRAAICHAHTHTQCRFVGNAIWPLPGPGPERRRQLLCMTPKIGCCTRGTGCWVRGRLEYCVDGAVGRLSRFVLLVCFLYLHGVPCTTYLPAEGIPWWRWSPSLLPTSPRPVLVTSAWTQFRAGSVPFSFRFARLISNASLDASEDASEGCST